MLMILIIGLSFSNIPSLSEPGIAKWIATFDSSKDERLAEEFASRSEKLVPASSHPDTLLGISVRLRTQMQEGEPHPFAR